MTVEAGAMGALIAPDQCAIDYVLSRAIDIVGNIQEQAISHWATLVSDADAVFDCEYSFDADKVAPYVTWGTSPDQAIPIDGAIPQPDALADDIANTSTLQALRYTGLSRSEEHTSELQSLMRISYAVFCLKKKNNTT